MRVLVVSQYFYPENFKINDIAFSLDQKGFEVTVLTSKPNYPLGKYYKGYNFFNKNSEKINGLSVIRVPTIPRMNGKLLGMSLNYLSFLFFSNFIVPFKIKNKYDVIFINQLSPITSCLPGIKIGEKYNIPIVLLVLDLWPESFYANTNIRFKFITKWIERVSTRVYKKSSHILVSSESFIEPIKKRVSNEKKISILPNWAEDLFLEKVNDKQSFEYKYPTGFNILFTGNIGESQGFEDVVSAAKYTNNFKINWIIVGDGRKKKWLEKKIEEENITNIYIVGRLPMALMPPLMSKANCLLLTLKNQKVFSNTLPAKFQTYLTAGKPLLGNISGEGKRSIEENELGLCVKPGNGTDLGKIAIKLQKTSDTTLNNYGKNCKLLYKRKYDKFLIIKKLVTIFEELKN